jgi:hypothetical protein
MLPPPAVRPSTVLLIEPFAFAVELQTGAVDEEMQWLRTVDVLRQYRQAADSSAERGMIRTGNGDAEHISDRPKQTFRLSERLMKHRAEREAGLDGDRRTDRLTAPRSGRRCVRCGHGRIGEPKTVILPRSTNAASYSGQFVNRYLALGILWRRSVQSKTRTPPHPAPQRREAGGGSTWRG